MKKFSVYTVLLSLVFIYAACNGKKDEKLTLFSPEAFAFQIDEKSYDVNAKIFVKGFEQTENNGAFVHNLSYEVALITPEGKQIDGLFKAKEDTPRGERVTDLPLEAQFELDSLYNPGKYKLVFLVKDEKSNQQTKAEKELDLE